MATYKGIKGVKVESKATDPGDTTEAVGNVWYNTTSYALKYAIAGAGVWSTGGGTNAEHHYTAAAKNATVTTGLCFGGFDGPTWPSPGTVKATEEYNGTAWTEVNDLNTSRALEGGAGTQTAALAWAGTPYVPSGTARTTACEDWDGTCWTTVNNVVVTKSTMGTIGTTKTACMSVGGYPGPANTTTGCEIWNGSSWTTSLALPTTVSSNTGVGTTTAGLNVGGWPPPKEATQLWDGTSWAEVNDTNAYHGNLASFGTQTSCIIAGSDSPTRAVTEKWDGTCWTVTTELLTPQYGMGGLGTSSLGLVVGGTPGTKTSEEWVDPVYAIKTVTTT